MGGVRDDWDRFYEFLIHPGQRCQLLSWSLLMIIVRYMKLSEQATIRVAIDAPVFFSQRRKKSTLR